VQGCCQPVCRRNPAPTTAGGGRSQPGGVGCAPGRRSLGRAGRDGRAAR
jgi:hypothetical protein